MAHVLRSKEWSHDANATLTLHEPRVVNALLFSRHGRPVLGPTWALNPLPSYTNWTTGPTLTMFPIHISTMSWNLAHVMSWLMTPCMANLVCGERRNNMWTLHFSKELHSHLGLGMLVLPKVKHISFLKHVRVWIIYLSIVIILTWKLWISLNMKLGIKNSEEIHKRTFVLGWH